MLDKDYRVEVVKKKPVTVVPKREFATYPIVPKKQFAGHTVPSKNFVAKPTAIGKMKYDKLTIKYSKLDL